MAYEVAMSDWSGVYPSISCHQNSNPVFRLSFLRIHHVTPCSPLKINPRSLEEERYIGFGYGTCSYTFLACLDPVFRLNIDSSFLRHLYPINGEWKEC